MRIGRVTVDGPSGEQAIMTDDPKHNLWAVCGSLMVALVILAIGGAAMNKNTAAGAIYIGMGVFLGFLALPQLSDFVRSFLGSRQQQHSNQ
jgi:hypothetical protein